MYLNFFVVVAVQHMHIFTKKKEKKHLNIIFFVRCLPHIMFIFVCVLSVHNSVYIVYILFFLNTMHCFVSHLLISLILFSRAAGIWRCFCYYGYSIRRPKAIAHKTVCERSEGIYFYVVFLPNLKMINVAMHIQFSSFFSSIYLVNTNLAGLVCGRQRGSQALRNCSEITWFGPKKRFRLG